MLDAISTNTTHLFREIRHFVLLREIITKLMGDTAWRDRHKELRIWSAGCSSGEEPYSIAMVVHDTLRSHPGMSAKILATDLSTQVLGRAKLGLFEAHRVGTVPEQLRRNYFETVQHEGKALLKVVEPIRRLISFTRFNLMSDTFPMKQGFDIIFCRNVMIYFDRPTQETLVGKYAKQLNPGGHLMIGHSESLSGVDHPLEYVEPTVYRKRQS